MKTEFSLAQLADPHVAESEKILRNCVHCGFCTATCPTYVLLGDELDSPRGRIYLIKDMLENQRPASAEVVKHIDRCLSCLACMTTCPSGVHYMHLVDHGRAYIEHTYRRPLMDRLLRAALAFMLPHPERFRLGLSLARWFKPLAAFLPKGDGRVQGTPSLLSRMRAMLALAPSQTAVSDLRKGDVHPAQGPRKGRVILMLGCAQEVLAPRINRAAIAFLTRHGIEVTLARHEECCGALVHHMGREEAALAAARANIDAWLGEADAGLDAILITASGCGTHVKDYGFMLRNDAFYAEKAARVSALARDISEYLCTLDLPARTHHEPLRVAYHSACSMQHGQKILRQPKDLLSKFGFVVNDIPEAHLCCGSAGTYNILQPDIAVRLRDRKVANIASVEPDVIATGNIGCLVQISGGTTIPVVHTIELLDWATGGHRPEYV